MEIKNSGLISKMMTTMLTKKKINSLYKPSMISRNGLLEIKRTYSRLLAVLSLLN